MGILFALGVAGWFAILTPTSYIVVILGDLIKEGKFYGRDSATRDSTGSIERP